MMVAKVVLSIKTTSKNVCYFFAQGVSFDFKGSQREKAHYNPLKYLPVMAHFLFVSTCVTELQIRRLSAPGDQCVTSSKNLTMPLDRRCTRCLLAGRQSRVEK